LAKENKGGKTTNFWFKNCVNCYVFGEKKKGGETTREHKESLSLEDIEARKERKENKREEKRTRRQGESQSCRH
jgi:hypothetical protein